MGGHIRNIMGRIPHSVYFIGVYLTGVHLMGMYLINVHLTGVHLMGVYLTGVHLMGVHLMGVHLTGVHLIGVHLTGVHLMGVHLMGLRVFLARRARVARVPVRDQGCLKLLNCGRLGRQAAGHPWSALRVVKSCRKDCPTASVLLEAKAAALHPERYQSSLSKLSTKEGG